MSGLWESQWSRKGAGDLIFFISFMIIIILFLSSSFRQKITRNLSLIRYKISSCCCCCCCLRNRGNHTPSTIEFMKKEEGWWRWQWLRSMGRKKSIFFKRESFEIRFRLNWIQTHTHQHSLICLMLFFDFLSEFQWQKLRWGMDCLTHWLTLEKKRERKKERRKKERKKEEKERKKRKKDYC